MVLSIGVMAGTEAVARVVDFVASMGRPPGLWAVGSLVAILLLVLLTRARRWIWEVLTSLECAVVLLALLAFSSALGTMVVQRVPGVDEATFRSQSRFATASLLYRLGWDAGSLSPISRASPPGGGMVHAAGAAGSRLESRPPAAYFEGLEDRFGAAVARRSRDAFEAAATNRETSRAVQDLADALGPRLDAWMSWADLLRLTSFPDAPWFRALLSLFAIGIVTGSVRFWPRRWRESGLAVSHLGIALLLIGAFLTSAIRKEGFLPLHSGRAIQAARGSAGPVNLPFAVRLDGFRVDRPRTLDVTLRDDSQFVFRHSLDPVAGRCYDLEGGRWRIEIVEALDESQLVPRSTAASPGMPGVDATILPALRLRVTEWGASDHGSSDDTATIVEQWVSPGKGRDELRLPISGRSLVWRTEDPGASPSRADRSVEDEEPMLHASWQGGQVDVPARPHASAGGEGGEDPPRIEVLEAWPDFRLRNESDGAHAESKNPAALVRVSDGSGSRDRWVFARFDWDSMHGGNPEKTDAVVLSLRWPVAPDAAPTWFLQWNALGVPRVVRADEGGSIEIPSGRAVALPGGMGSVERLAWIPRARWVPAAIRTRADEERLDPPAPAAVRLRVHGPEEDRDEWLLTVPGHDRLVAAGGDLEIGLRDDARGMPRSFRSLVSLLEDGRVVRRALVAVNHPLSYRGWRLYQADWDPARPDYSGLDAKWDPAVPVFQVGAWILLAGSFLAFAGRWRSLLHGPGSRSASTKAARVVAAGDAEGILVDAAAGIRAAAEASRGRSQREGRFQEDKSSHRARTAVGAASTGLRAVARR